MNLMKIGEMNTKQIELTGKGIKSSYPLVEPAEQVAIDTMAAVGRMSYAERFCQQ